MIPLVNIGDGKHKPGKETEEECKITTFGIQQNQSKIYSIVSLNNTVLDPMLNDYIGTHANYFRVMLITGGSATLFTNMD